MSGRSTNIAEGDTLTLTITGKVTDPALGGTEKATTLRVNRPGTTKAILVDAVLDADAEISYEVTSRFKNGVHLDESGKYWMRRPGGWHEMTTADKPVPNYFGRQFAPRGAQRLREDKDQPE